MKDPDGTRWLRGPLACWASSKVHCKSDFTINSKNNEVLNNFLKTQIPTE